MKIAIALHPEGEIGLEVDDARDRYAKITIDKKDGSVPVEASAPIDSIAVAIEAISNMAKRMVAHAVPVPKTSEVRVKEAGEIEKPPDTSKSVYSR